LLLYSKFHNNSDEIDLVLEDSQDIKDKLGISSPNKKNHQLQKQFKNSYDLQTQIRTNSLQQDSPNI